MTLRGYTDVHKVDFAFVDGNIYIIAGEAKMIGSPPHRRGGKLYPERPISIDIDKRIKEVKYTPIDLKRKFNQNVGSWLEWIEKTYPKFYSAWLLRLGTRNRVAHLLDKLEGLCEYNNGVGVEIYHEVSGEYRWLDIERSKILSIDELIERSATLLKIILKISKLYYNYNIKNIKLSSRYNCKNIMLQIIKTLALHLYSPLRKSMFAMRRCPVCGKPMEGNLEMCPECYAERKDIFWLDDIIELVKCPRCGFFKIKGKWKEISFEDALVDAIYSSLRVLPEFEVEDVFVSPLTRGEVGRFVVKLEGLLDGKFVRAKKVVEVRVKREVCKRCSREAGGYYESIVQIRADDREISEEELEVVRNIIIRVLEREKENQKAFISKIVERKEGIDYYFGDRNIGRKISRLIAEELGGKIIESKKIHTRRDGQDVYRFTYAVRLPAYRKGDVVEENGRICIVTSQRLGKAVSLESGETINLRNPKLIARRGEVKESVVISCDEFVVEVLHPVTQEVVQAKKPKAELKPGDLVFVVEHDESIYVIPKELL